MYEPGATITGGSSPRSSDLLLRLSRLSEMEENLAALKQDFASIARDNELNQKMVEHMRQLDSEARRLEYELNGLRNVMNASSASQVSGWPVSAVLTFIAFARS